MSTNSIPIAPDKRFPLFRDRLRAFTCLWIWAAQQDSQMTQRDMAGAPITVPLSTFATRWDHLASIAGRAGIDEWRHTHLRPFKRRIAHDFWCHQYTFQYVPYQTKPNEAGIHVIDAT